MDWLKTLAPTVATAIAGPLGGAAVQAIGSILGVSDATQTKIADVITAGQMTPEQIGKIKELELQYQNDEKERGFKYSELEFKDRDSARQMAAATHSITPSLLTWVIVIAFLVIEGCMLFGVKTGASELVVGRILGTLDTSLGLVLAFWFGANSGSARTKELLAQATMK